LPVSKSICLGQVLFLLVKMQLENRIPVSLWRAKPSYKKDTCIKKAALTAAFEEIEKILLWGKRRTAA